MGVLLWLLVALGQKLPDVGSPVRVVDLLLQDLLQVEVLGVLRRLRARVADVALSVESAETETNRASAFV
jgi:hypothetical protein